MIALYDPHGNKIDRGKLKEEESAPSLRSIRQVISGSPSAGLTPQRLANIFKAADHGDPHAQCELFEDMEEKDLHLSSIMGTRKRAVTGLEIRVEAPDNANAREKQAAELAQEHLANIPDLPEKLVDVLDAIGKGYSVTEIIWAIHRQEAIIEDLCWREPKWFRFDQESMSELRLLDLGYVDGKPLTPYKYITHIHKAKSGIAVRGGILRPCAWMYLFKNYDFKDWVTFAEIYAQPLRVGKYPTSASENEKDVLLQAVANMGTDAAAIIPDSMLIEFIEAGGKTGSTDLYERLARFCDEQMSKGVLGQTSSTDAMAGGLGSGQANLHGDVRHDLLKSDARQLSGTLSRDLTRPLIDLNMGPVDRYPKVKVIIEEPEDMKELADNTKTLHDMGLPISKLWLYKKFNIPEPEQGEAVLGASTQPPAGTRPVATGKTAANAQQAGNAVNISDNPSDIAAERMVSASDPAIGDWLTTIESMLANAESLPQFREMLLAAFSNLPDAKLAGVLEQGSIAIQAAGRFDLENE
jgi:phage gp29-like protein